MSSCAGCEKAPPAVTLKRCAKCQTTSYCSRDCQKDDWKQHKKICAKQAASDSASGSGSGSSFGRTPPWKKPSPPKGLEAPVLLPWTRLQKKTYLHDRPNGDIGRILIDAYRLRMEDDYKFAGEVDPGSLYAGTGNPLPHFRRFLGKVERTGLLPGSWDADAKSACLALAGDEREENWYSVRTGVEKSDLIERYGDDRFPMQLRMLLEPVFGGGPGGQSGEMMLGVLVKTEQEGGVEGRHFSSFSL